MVGWYLQHVFGLLENLLMFLHWIFIITGDFNIHVDNDMTSNAKEITARLETFGLLHHVERAHTHTQGHTLDLVISKGADISFIDVKDLTLFDLCHFMEAITMLPTVSAETFNEFLDNFTWEISIFVDTFATLKIEKTWSRQKTPWMYTMMVKALGNTMEERRVM